MRVALADYAFQGGSDVRANTTVARPVDPARTGSGAAFLLTGHKWFTSAPMSDGFLTLSNTLDEKVNGLCACRVSCQCDRVARAAAGVSHASLCPEFLKMVLRMKASESCV
jgi:alkylation response protein AidB-like acyl-CoA dehydrogenase